MKYSIIDTYLGHMPGIDWHTVPVDTVMEFFAVTGELGLSDAEVSRRRAVFGKNTQHGLAHPSGLGYSVRVRRQGLDRLIPVPDLVIGDIVLLAAGDHIPASIRLVQSDGLQIDEHRQTGNALYSRKTAHIGGSPSNMVHCGSVVVSGIGKGVVTELPRTRSAHQRSLRDAWRSRRLLQYGLVVQNPAAVRLLAHLKVLVVSAKLTVEQQSEVQSLCARANVACLFEDGDVTTVLSVIARLQGQPTHVAWASDGARARLYRNAASVSVALGGSDANKLAADFVSIADPATAIQGILYNIK